jgi:hypothetical protein
MDFGQVVSSTFLSALLLMWRFCEPPHELKKEFNLKDNGYVTKSRKSILRKDKNG